ncbi:MAG: ATP-dependent Clp protease ATP-binding subunit, partial [Clostridia bacterium]|nr:ATP-dependent Clp protease ATP-binding subunit [Clostridia bacterium]
MTMCSRCHKRVAVIFVTKMENNQRTSQGLCIKCAKEMGLPVNNMLGGALDKFGITQDQVENMENELTEMLETGANIPSEMDDNSDGGAPAMDIPQLFRDAGFMQPSPQESTPPKEGQTEKNENNQQKQAKKYKFLSTYSRNLTQAARDGKLDRIVGREKELERMTQILCRRQ